MLLNPCNSKLGITLPLLDIEKLEAKIDHRYLPKSTCLVNRVEISHPALVLKCLLLKPQNSSGSLKRKYGHHHNFTILEDFTFVRVILLLFFPVGFLVVTAENTYQ